MKGKTIIFIFLSLAIVLITISCNVYQTTSSTEKKSIETTTGLTITKTKIILPTIASTTELFLSKEITVYPSSTIVPTQTMFNYISSTPRPTPLCFCNRDYDCLHFYSQKQAQFCFDYCNGSINFNWSGLDDDRDGLACEDLP